MKAAQLQLFTALFMLVFFHQISNAQTPKRTNLAVTPLIREEPNRVPRWLEIRLGPRFSGIDGKIRPGRDASSQLDLQKDFQLDEPAIGPQLEFEMRVADRWHATLAYSGNDFKGPMVTTTRDIYFQSTYSPALNPNTAQNPALLRAGSVIQEALDINIIQGSIKYDAYKDEHFTVSPLLGCKAVFLEAKTTVHPLNSSSEIKNVQNIDEVIPVLGADTKAFINEYVYVGLTGHAFAWERFVYVGGQGYVGTDFNKTWGLRLGMDVDYVDIGRKDVGTPYAASTALYAGFIEGVYGF